MRPPNTGGRRSARSAPAPLPVRLELPLGDVFLNASLATSLLHALIKFVICTRGQTHIPYELLREDLQNALEALQEQAEESRRSSGGRKGRRLRPPSAVKRMTKFAASMDALLGSLTPQLLAAVRPAHTVLALGPSPHRPREVYTFTFAGPDGTPLTHIPTQPPPPTPTLMPESGRGKAPSALPGPAQPPAQQSALRPATQSAGVTAASAPSAHLGPDPTAAVLSLLSDREQAVVRRVVRGLVMAQTSVEAWGKLLRPTKMFLALAVPAGAAATDTGGGAMLGIDRSTGMGTGTGPNGTVVHQGPGGGSGGSLGLGGSEAPLSEVPAGQAAGEVQPTGVASASASVEEESQLVARGRSTRRGGGAGGFRLCGRLPYGADSANSRTLRKTLQAFITIRTGSGRPGAATAAAGAAAGRSSGGRAASPDQVRRQERPACRMSHDDVRNGDGRGGGSGGADSPSSPALSSLQLTTSTQRLGHCSVATSGRTRPRRISAATATAEAIKCTADSAARSEVAGGSGPRRTDGQHATDTDTDAGTGTDTDMDTDMGGQAGVEAKDRVGHRNEGQGGERGIGGTGGAKGGTGCGGTGSISGGGGGDAHAGNHQGGDAPGGDGEVRRRNGGGDGGGGDGGGGGLESGGEGNGENVTWWLCTTSVKSIVKQEEEEEG
ncbi:hypothetical protein VOLCADRAFT_89031 [Volvox carteri f. nagariensis]|uniref:HORMA domain-containing protein n=1 Tax=Volvox carteri f. nagariensis TaxID=3068 RepID=D8TQL8_VOLCA|nr:uncharacterized protein VOLCADRAFT_89031 [Volvox carteri f. nagariensis]EFJ50058.1 hypothetical protein VOLCADRAFT_89031 [Volvox carteri f. nagariensis]|eukprot:XP_002948678.1 hypothetical protein VOLCADRAFT_89031 [Volvox carteri f. nagariensis]